MKVTRTSTLSGTVRTLDLNVLPGQMESYNAGALLQDAFPQLSQADREFIKTGITEEEWDAIFG